MKLTMRPKYINDFTFNTDSMFSNPINGVGTKASAPRMKPACMIKPSSRSSIEFGEDSPHHVLTQGTIIFNNTLVSRMYTIKELITNECIANPIACIPWPRDSFITL